MASRFSAIGIVRRPLGDDEEFVHSDFSGSSAILPKKFAGILGMCAEWATLDDHAAQVADILGLSRNQVKDVQALLSDFANKQLVACEDTIRSGFIKAAQSSINAAAHIGSLVIVTRNRPEMLLRCVRSYVANFQAFKRAIDIVVVDDSEDIRVRSQALSGLSAVPLPAGVKLFYYGQKEIDEFARRLAASAESELDIVRFAICRDIEYPFAVGASRNVSLLATCGQMFVTVDDDTVCDCGDVPEICAGLRLSSTPDPTEWWLVADRGEAKRLAPTRELDLMGYYERFLGNTVASLVAREDDLNCEYMNSSFLQGVVESNASVAVCAMGVKGDCSLFVPSLYFTFDGGSYNRLVSSESAYRNAFVSREVVRSAPQFTISNTATCTTNNLGIDNRRRQPPFLPKLYGEDILFGMLLNICRKDSYSGHLPAALLHDADLTRKFKPMRATDCEPGMQAAHLLALLIERFAPHLQSNTPEDNFMALGRYFQLLGAESPEQFHGFIRHEWLNQTARSIALLKKRIARLAPTAPSFFLDDLHRVLETLKAAMLKASPTPLDMMPDGNAARSWQLFQELLVSYGRLLEHWPGLVHSAAAINTTPHSCAIEIRSNADLEAGKKASWTLV